LIIERDGRLFDGRKQLIIMQVAEAHEGGGMVYANLTWNNDPVVSEYFLEAFFSGDHMLIFSYRREPATALHCMRLYDFPAARLRGIRMHARTVREFGTLFVKQFEDVDRLVRFTVPMAFLLVAAAELRWGRA
jgi:hypothetical protein